MEDNRDGNSAKSAEQDSEPVSVSEVTIDQNTAAPVTTSLRDKTGSAHSIEVSTSHAQVPNQAVPSQGEFPLHVH